jgi:8-oxo-dGTP diphosphatase
MSIKRVVAGLIVVDGKFLICQRTRHQPFPMKWEFPGGKIEPGEQPEAALTRELEEELGILAEIGPLVAVVRHSYGSGAVVELQFFLVERFQGEIQNRIFREVRWVSREVLPTFDFLAADIELVNELAAGKPLVSIDRSVASTSMPRRAKS